MPYFVPKMTPAKLVTNGGEPQPFVTRRDQRFVDSQLVVDPIKARFSKLEPRYERYHDLAIQMVHGFELAGNKNTDARYLLLVEGKYVIVEMPQ